MQKVGFLINRERFLALCAGVFLAFALIEVALRVIPNHWQEGRRMGVFDADIGNLPAPSQTFACSTECFHVSEIHVNSFGFRDRERQVKKNNPRVALLGDSFLEAIQVRDGEVINSRLEQILPPVEFLNFGVNDFGTTQELLLYKKKVRDFSPDIVLLFFCSNDVRNNSCILESYTGRYKGGVSCKAHFNKLSDGSLKLIPPSPAYSNRLWELEKYFLSVRVIAEFRHKLHTQRLKKLSKKHGASEKGQEYYWPPLFIDYGVMQKPKDKDWDEAWEITEELLLRLRDAVEKDGTRFVLVALAEKIPVDPNPLLRVVEDTGLALPPDFDPDYINRRLEAFSRTNKMKYLSLTPYFRRYRDEHALQYPYFFYTCDGHWNALGHKVAAEAVADYLVGEGLIPKEVAVQGVKN
jgi:hypothetical protein